MRGSAETSYPGTGEFIAFFDKAGAWNFTAVPLSKSTVASDVLTIHPANLESFVNGVIRDPHHATATRSA